MAQFNLERWRRVADEQRLAELQQRFDQLPPEQQEADTAWVASVSDNDLRESIGAAVDASLPLTDPIPAPGDVPPPPEPPGGDTLDEDLVTDPPDGPDAP